MRADMPSDRQRLLYKLATLGALLRCVARTHSDDLTTSTRSLVCQDTQKCAPRSVQNALCQSTARQSTQVQVLDNDCRIRIGVAFHSLEMKIAALALDLQMCLCRAPRHLTTATAALLARTQAALLAAQGRLARPKETRIFDHTAVAVSKKHFQPDIQANSRTVIISRLRQIALRRQFAH